MAVLARGVSQAGGHGGSVLQRQLFGRFSFLEGFVLPLGFQHALEVQACRHICKGHRTWNPHESRNKELWSHHPVPAFPSQFQGLESPSRSRQANRMELAEQGLELVRTWLPGKSQDSCTPSTLMVQALTHSLAKEGLPQGDGSSLAITAGL